jgi:1-acyl-sn-glycerol-3-phosphate acyltransferase
MTLSRASASAVLQPGTVERFPRFYRPLQTATRRLLDHWFGLRVTGLDQLPRRGGCIVAANHHNYLDGIVIGAVLPRQVSFLVMPRVYHATVLHPLFHRWARTIPLDVERADFAAIRRALGVLECGGVVGIFPEGPFSIHGRLERGLPGVGMLALRSGAPVVPMAIQGTYQALVGRRYHLPRLHPLSVHVGAPRTFSRTRGRCDKALREDVTRRIMADIADLLS